MKFSISFILAAIPLLSQVTAVAVPDAALVARQRGNGRNRGGAAAAAAAAAARARQRGGRNRGGAAAGGNAAGAGGAAAGGAANNGTAPATGANNGAANNGTATGNNGAATGNNGAATGNNNGAGNNNNAGAGGAAGNGNNNAGNGGAAGGNVDPQESLTLDPKVIAPGFAQDGQAQPTAGQVASLTSKNNFINFCLTQPNLPLTDGKQITTGSCNPAPIGVIPSVDNMPSSKFVFPENGATIPSDQQFTVQMAIKNLDAGNFVNAQANYFAAPQTLKGGIIVGHTHVTIEKLSALNQKTVTDPKVFQFFKGINTAAVNGIVTADVTAGLPPAAYRMCSINSSSNHQPVIVPVAQHGSLDDCVYFTTTPGGAAAGGAANNNAGGAANNNAGGAANNNNAAGANNNAAGANNNAAGANNNAAGANNNAAGANNNAAGANNNANGGNQRGQQRQRGGRGN